MRTKCFAAEKFSTALMEEDIKRYLY